MSQKTERKVSKAEVADLIEKSKKGNDQLRVDGLQSLLTVRSKKAKLQAREKNRLKQKYDTKDMRVKNIGAQLSANADYINNLKVETTRAGTAAKVLGETDWAVQGYVYDKKGCPVENAKVAMYSRGGQQVEQIGETSTNKKGYYLLILQTDEKAVLDRGDTAAEEAGAEAENIEIVAGAAAGLRINTNVDAVADAKNTTGLKRSLRINRAELNKTQVFVRAIDSRDDSICADSTAIIPRIGVSNYRDLVLNFDQCEGFSVGKGDRRATQYLGNSSTRELHDLKNEKKQCQIDEIRIDHCFAFVAEKDAVALGYDFCGFCFGKEKSKR